MWEFLRAHQLSIMLFLSGACGILALLALMTTSISKSRKRILVSMEIGAMFLLLSDRAAYIYRGDTSTFGFWAVRISNFLVYFLTLFLLHVLTTYLIDLYHTVEELQKAPRRLIVCEVLFTLGTILLIISAFTGLYYTFDASNNYQRAPGFLLSYLFPVMITMLQLSLIFQIHSKISRKIYVPIIIFTLITMFGSVIQLFAYGLSVINISTVGIFVMLFIFVLMDLNERAEKANRMEIEYLKDEQEKIHNLFEQTAEALASAIDAKDQYTHGHSTRVAEYSREIARLAGKTEEECEEIYFSALLHDVGKIGVPDAIINKDGRLTDEEFDAIRRHPVIGNQILSSISVSPYLSIGAHYHHERYDGRGYPDGLIGDDIPEIARIISVADSYDAMTSKRSYRDPIPQQKVREEIIKGFDTQFDARFAKIMLHMIDLDTEYGMKEQSDVGSLTKHNELHCVDIGNECSQGILLTQAPTHIRVHVRPMSGYDEKQAKPTLLLFDALDGRVHGPKDKLRKDLMYFEYGKLDFDGTFEAVGCRNYKQTSTKGSLPISQDRRGIAYEIDAVRVKDHLQLRVTNYENTNDIIIALPDSTRFAYLSLTGVHCDITISQVRKGEQDVADDYIPRIAEEISYIKDMPRGDLSNVQIDGWCQAFTEPFPIVDGTQIRFHSMSLPTAHLVWHCPYINIFSSTDGTVKGPGYREFVLVRMDGENWESDAHVKNTMMVQHSEDFGTWEQWKTENKAGLDFIINIKRSGNRITIDSENGGIIIHCVTEIQDNVDAIYGALTGDQVALTNIHVTN